MRADLSWLENPEVFRVNRLDAHSDHHFYETEEGCRAREERLRQSLNGTWRFAWSPCPKERPADFYREDADLEDFGEITVPGHMELQGYGKIQYINTIYPWDGHAFLRPPHIDWTDNPVGSYVKEFDLNPELAGKRICISFQGVEQAAYVWLNGVFIGYAEDGFTPSDFDLTEAIREKGNRLCVEVYKRSSAAWLEDQDFFRFSGIFREVYLYAKPEAHVEDLFIKAGLEEDGETGTLLVEAKISGREDICVSWSLEAEDGQNAGGDRFVRGEAAEEFFGSERARLWSAQDKIPQVHRWHAGKPYLYRLSVRLHTQEGKLLEVVPYRVGFRRFEIRDGVMRLNGERLIVNGVNRHEWNPRSGRCVTREDMERDIEILKRNNINAVRTSHYPNQSLWYELCDEAGICVMDETNLESHGSWQKLGGAHPEWNVPGSLPQWESCVLDRAASMLERDKNHPSILWWSCGNESYAGTCILAMSRYFHQKDPSRPVHYEGVYWNRAFHDISDVESRMYAPPREVRDYLENNPKKPYLLCEYMHDMGNSIGGMESYIRFLDEFEQYQGGFIWDFIDQAIYHKDHSGREVLGYGGDFGDRPTDYAFSGNGIVFANRQEKPAMQEVRYWYSSPQMREAFDRENEENRARSANRLAQEMREADERCGLADEAVDFGSDAKGTADSGAASFGLDEAVRGDRDRTLRVIHGDGHYGVSGEGFEILFSFPEGGPVSLKYDGREYLYRAPRPAFWRASTENDKGCGFASASAVWMAADQFARCRGCSIREYGKDRVDTMEVGDFAGRRDAAEDLRRVELTFTYGTGTVPDTTAQITYTVDGSGRIHVKLHYAGVRGLPQLPEFGLRLVLPEKIASYTWEGLSGETYPDRKKGGRFGAHQSTPEIPAYLVPQECGNHADTQQLQIGSLRFVMDGEPFHCSVLWNTPQELEQALHREELPDTGRTIVSVLARMRGVGGIDSWGADVEEAYHVSSGEDITFGFYICRAEKEI